jgi:hypothetical protein
MEPIQAAGMAGPGFQFSGPDHRADRRGIVDAAEDEKFRRFRCYQHATGLNAASRTCKQLDLP